MQVVKQIGNTTHHFTVTGENLHQCQMEAQKLSFYNVPTCGLCGSEKLYLRAYITEADKYEYIKICCGGCKATLTFGKSKKDKDTFFLRRRDDGMLDWQAFKETQAKNEQYREEGKEEIPI